MTTIGFYPIDTGIFTSTYQPIYTNPHYQTDEHEMTNAQIAGGMLQRQRAKGKNLRTQHAGVHKGNGLSTSGGALHPAGFKGKGIDSGMAIRSGFDDPETMLREGYGLSTIKDIQTQTFLQVVAPEAQTFNNQYKEPPTNYGGDEQVGSGLGGGALHPTGHKGKGKTGGMLPKKITHKKGGKIHLEGYGKKGMKKHKMPKGAIGHRRPKQRPAFVQMKPPKHQPGGKLKRKLLKNVLQKPAKNIKKIADKKKRLKSLLSKLNY